MITNNCKNIKVSQQRGVFTIQLYRPEANNSINGLLIKELMMVLVQIESNPEIKVVVLEGLPDVFCSGMDFQSVYHTDSEEVIAEDPNKYYDLLKHLSLCSKIIVAKVEGKVNAGGIGLVAVSDIVIADQKATFGLSEALFGLLPACVLPFLMRRIGYQKAQWMALVSQGISANRAFQIGLVDEISDNVNEAVRKNLLRLIRLETSTVMDLKDYMSKLWIINEQTQELAVNKISILLNSEKVQSNIKNFVENEKFPWDK